LALTFAIEDMRYIVWLGSIFSIEAFVFEWVAYTWFKNVANNESFNLFSVI